jgi:N-methylhydantoinase A
VTDALLVLGYLDAARFLGGDMALDVSAAEAACARLGASLGMDAAETAWGIRQVAIAGMTKAVRSRLAARGLDPRDQVIMSYGGCGGLFTPDIAAAVGSGTVLLPGLASVLSAFGAATTDVRRERLRAVLEPMPADLRLVEKVCAELRGEVDGDLAADGIAETDRTVGFEADLRFKRQVWELSIPIASTGLEGGGLESLLERFKDEYGRRYGRGSIVLGAPVELVSLRAVGEGRTVRASLEAGRPDRVAEDTAAQAGGQRSVRLDRGGEGAHPVDVYDAARLLPGHVLHGPALIDGTDTTIWVPRGATVRLGPHGTFTMELAP